VNAVNDRHAHAAELLSAHPDFRVQRRLMPVTTFHEAVPFVPNRITKWMLTFFRRKRLPCRK